MSRRKPRRRRECRIAWSLASVLLVRIGVRAFLVDMCGYRRESYKTYGCSDSGLFTGFCANYVFSS